MDAGKTFLARNGIARILIISLPSGSAPDAGWSSLVARQAHNLKVVGSNPAPATTFNARSASRCGLFLCPNDRCEELDFTLQAIRNLGSLHKDDATLTERLNQNGNLLLGQ